MKKTLGFCLVIIFLFTVASFAQAGFGYKFGLTNSDYEGGIENTERRFGFITGLYAEIPLYSSFTIQPEILYVQKGANERTSVLTAKQTLNYLEIPLLLKYRLPFEMNMITPFISVGPSFCFLLSGETDVNGELDDVEYYKSVDYSMNIDVGVELSVGNSEINAGIRYNYGLKNIVDVAGVDLELRNNYLSFILGYEF